MVPWPSWLTKTLSNADYSFISLFYWTDDYGVCEDDNGMVPDECLGRVE